MRHADAANGDVPRLLWMTAMTYIFASPLDVVPLPWNVSPATVTGALFLGSWILALARGEVRIPRTPTLLSALALLSMWSFATVSWSYAPSASWGRAISTLFLGVSAVAIASVMGGRARPAALALGAGATVSGVWTLISGPETLETPSGMYIQIQQASFLDIDQNALAFILSIGLASALYVVLRANDSRLRLVAVGMTGVLVAALVLVGSRTGIGSMIAVVALFMILSLRSGPALVVALMSLSVGAIAVRWIASAGLVPLRILDWLQHPILTDSRTEIIDAYRMTQSEWNLRGVGAGADSYYLFSSTSWFKSAHGAFWKIWIELGLVGLLLWGLSLACLVLWASRSPEKSYFLLVLPALVFFFFTLGPLTSNVLWVVFGVAWGSAMAPHRGNFDRRARRPDRVNRLDPVPRLSLGDSQSPASWSAHRRVTE